MLCRIGPYVVAQGLDNRWHPRAIRQLDTFDVDLYDFDRSNCVMIDVEKKRSYSQKSGHTARSFVWVHADWLVPAVDYREVFDAL